MAGGRKVGNGPGKGSAGDGWGGPAKGASTAPRFAKGGKPPPAATKPDGLTTEQRREVLRQHLYTLATTAERQETQLSATVAYLNRVEGMPIARTELTGKDGGPVETTIAEARRSYVDEMMTRHAPAAIPAPDA